MFFHYIILSLDFTIVSGILNIPLIKVSISNFRLGKTKFQVCQIMYNENFMQLKLQHPVYFDSFV